MHFGADRNEGSAATRALSAGELTDPRVAAVVRARQGGGPAAARQTVHQLEAGTWDSDAPRQRRERREGAECHGLSRDDLMSMAETSDLLGVNVRTVYRLIDRQQIPGARRLGRTVVVVRPILERRLLTGAESPR